MLSIAHGIPQGSVLGPLLFLIYINDLHRAIRFSTTRHFADDTNLLYTIDFSKLRNRNPTRKLNIDLKSLNQWLIANKISLNASKTELIYFRNKKNDIPKSKVKLNGIKLHETSHVKYVGITFDEHLNFERHIKLLNAKLQRANNLLAISRHYLKLEILLQIYYGQFYSHLTYGCQLWGQNENAIKQTIILQKNAVRLITFSHYQAHTSPLFKKLRLLKLPEIVKQSNIGFTHNVINKKAPMIFENYFTFTEATHCHYTVNNLKSTYSNPIGSLMIPTYNSNAGKTSIKYICADTWNQLLKELSIKDIKEYNKNKFWMIMIKVKSLLNLIKKHFLEKY